MPVTLSGARGKLPELAVDPTPLRHYVVVARRGNRVALTAGKDRQDDDGPVRDRELIRWETGDAESRLAPGHLFE